MFPCVAPSVSQERVSPRVHCHKQIDTRSIESFLIRRKEIGLKENIVALDFLFIERSKIC